MLTQPNKTGHLPRQGGEPYEVRVVQFPPAALVESLLLETLREPSDAAVTTEALVINCQRLDEALKGPINGQVS